MATSGSWDIEWASGTWEGLPRTLHWSGDYSRGKNTITLSNMKIWFTVTGGTVSAYHDAESISVFPTNDPLSSTWGVYWGNFSDSSISNVINLSGNIVFSISPTATSAVIYCSASKAPGENGSATIYFDAMYGNRFYGPVNDVAKGTSKLYGSVSGGATEVTKLYGSVGGQTKIIHQGFGHAQPKYGRVYYKADPTDPASPIQSVELQSVAEFDSLGKHSSMSWTTTVGKDQITLSNKSTNAIIGLDIGSEISSITYLFLERCTYFNMPLVIPKNITQIGDTFLEYCFSFNQPLILSDSLTSIGSLFLDGCGSFNQPLNLPGSITSIGDSFMKNCSSMISPINVGSLSSDIISVSYTFTTNNSSAPCYATGIPIAGNNRAAWLAKFPNSGTNPYRKLLDAGY